MDLKKVEKKDEKRLKKIYLEAFPKKERKPFWLMRLKAKKGVMELLAIQEGRQTVGLAFTVLCEDMVLLDYFAIDRACRGQHLGSKALWLIQRRYQKQRFFLEIEQIDEDAPNNAERIRRKHFYLTNGMQETGIKASVFQVPMEILTDGKPLTYEEYDRVYQEAIGPVFARQVRRLP